MNKKDKRTLLILVIVSISSCLLIFHKEKKREERLNLLKENFIVNEIEVKNVSIYKSKGNKRPDLEYYLENKKYEKTNLCLSMFNTIDINDFIGRKFLVAYQKGRIDNNFMLISKKEYSFFKLPYPDSLYILDQKYFRCQENDLLPSDISDFFK